MFLLTSRLSHFIDRIYFCLANKLLHFDPITSMDLLGRFGDNSGGSFLLNVKNYHFADDLSHVCRTIFLGLFGSNDSPVGSFTRLA